MGSKYYYSDIENLIDKLFLHYTETETLVDQILEAGKSVTGIEGTTYDAISNRFTYRYSTFQERQVAARETAFQAISYCLDSFLELDNSSAIIYIERLNENQRYTSEKFGELTNEIEKYNRSLRNLSSIGVGIDPISTSTVTDQLDELNKFIWDLKLKLTTTNFMAVLQIDNSLSAYEELISGLLSMFGLSQQLAFLDSMNGRMSLSALEKIKKRLEEDNAEYEFEMLMREHKQDLMKSLGLDSDEEFEEFLKGAKVNQKIWLELKDEIEEFSKMTTDEKYALYPDDYDPAATWLFLSRLDEFTYDQRYQILEIMKQKDEISADQLKNILGLSNLSKEETKNLEYRAIEIGLDFSFSRWGTTAEDMMYQARKDYIYNITAGALLTLNPANFMDITGELNPGDNMKNLDPNSRLDNIELRTSQGLHPGHDYQGKSPVGPIGGGNSNQINSGIGTDGIKFNGEGVGEVGKGASGADKWKINETYSSDKANSWWKDNMGYDNPPYKPGTKVNEITLTEDTTFVRVYDGETSRQAGGWLMKAEDIQGLTPQQIQDKFALPTTPKYVTDAVIPANTTLRTGIVNPLDGWGSGGGTQFDLMGQRVGEFTNIRPLQ